MTYEVTNISTSSLEVGGVIIPRGKTKPVPDSGSQEVLDLSARRLITYVWEPTLPADRLSDDDVSGVQEANKLASRTLPAKAVTSWWPFSEGSGLKGFDQSTVNIEANALGTTTGMWTNPPGLNGNNSVKLACTQSVANLRNIFDLSSMIPGQTQVLVSFLLIHPTTPSGNGAIFCWGLLGDPAFGGWGVRLDSASQWLALSLLPRGGTLQNYPLDSVQTGQKLQVNGTNTATACCLVLERSAAFPGHMIVKFYAQPNQAAELGQQPSQTLFTIPEPSGAASLPGVGGGELTFLAFTSTNQAAGFNNVLGAGYQVANFLAQRRGVSNGSIGARVAKEVMAAYKASTPYVLSATAKA